MTGEHADQVVVKKVCLIINQHVDLLTVKRADLVTDEEIGFILPWFSDISLVTCKNFASFYYVQK